MTMQVRVYKNLHRKCYSIVANEGPLKGRVIAYRTRLDLTDVTFKVNEAGMWRVWNTGQKNVHAYVLGVWASPTHQPRKVRTISYNPMRGIPAFVIRAEPYLEIVAAERVTLAPEGMWAAGVETRQWYKHYGDSLARMRRERDEKAR
jgi:hypothetical protein